MEKSQKLFQEFLQTAASFYEILPKTLKFHLQVIQRQKKNVTFYTWFLTIGELSLSIIDYRNNQTRSATLISSKKYRTRFFGLSCRILKSDEKLALLDE